MAGNDRPVRAVVRFRETDTGVAMIRPHQFPAPPHNPAWDIAFTRLAQVVRPQVDTFVRDLARRFEAIGLGCDTRVRQTPRGLSTFLAVIGRRGLLCIVDITLVDDMAVARRPRAELDVRLLDACGAIVAAGLAEGLQDWVSQASVPAGRVMTDGMARVVTAVYVSSLAHFDLLQPVPTPGANAPRQAREDENASPAPAPEPSALYDALAAPRRPTG